MAGAVEVSYQSERRRRDSRIEVAASIPSLPQRRAMDKLSNEQNYFRTRDVVEES